MEFRIFYALLPLLIISTGTTFAQESLLSIETDDNNYDEGDTIVIFGNVNTIIGETPVLVQIIHEGAIIEIAQITVGQDGTFTKIIIAEGGVWKKGGEYTIRAFYQEHVAESTFSFIPKSEAIEITTNFEVDAGSKGTFDVKYTIRGGAVKNMIVDSEMFELIVQIDAIDEGMITLDLPREFIGAEKQDGKDEKFIILIDGIEALHQESVVGSDSRVITINFEQEDSDIEIIGTYVVPEFSTIAVMILIVGIMATIAMTRNKIQIKI
ncbi:PEFG-CTERM sorting domain-containing protein [Nitrosopumilus ureiphilus]|uniref:PEFG-CTERM sorting domain-containing protein n=1 Tax=Nitrosopumilus ureiphilus TaxID=1470067 RepID=A0A7D5R6G3_9ARCH|nr:PEFG-CTERM sorting domain-containing protein [Nitrosopumilus ureiphilus]QLH06059.1 PEFG-CTERM sorting domain-containing protein [Nitrosopumilus ureiphilus]